MKLGFSNGQQFKDFFQIERDLTGMLKLIYKHH